MGRHKASNHLQGRPRLAEVLPIRGSIRAFDVHLDIKQLLDRKAIENKRGTLSSGEIKLLVKEIRIAKRKADSNRA